MESRSRFCHSREGGSQFLDVSKDSLNGFPPSRELERASKGNQNANDTNGGEAEQRNSWPLRFVAAREEPDTVSTPEAREERLGKQSWGKQSWGKQRAAVGGAGLRRSGGRLPGPGHRSSLGSVMNNLHLDASQTAMRESDALSSGA